MDKNLFSADTLTDLRKRELLLMERNEKGYYRCKERYYKLYNATTVSCKTYITPDMIKQLNHPYSTNPNESMNTSVTAFVPKGKTYLLTASLDTRVGIAGAIQVVGYFDFWKQVFDEFGITMDVNLRLHLETRDRVKGKKRAVSKTMKGKRARSEQKYSKYNRSAADYLKSMKAGMFYESSVAVATAKKSLKDTVKDRNPTGTSPEGFVCIYYHPLYCTKRVHKFCSSPNYMMKTKTKEERNGLQGKEVSHVRF